MSVVNCTLTTSIKGGQKSKVVTAHKEESISWIESDAVDRENLRTTISTFTDPLDPSTHTGGLVNIANGLMPLQNVNVDNALELEKHQLEEFEAG